MGAILETTGGGVFFIDMAYALTGRFFGGPAKASVVAFGFMESVSGFAVGNTCRIVMAGAWDLIPVKTSIYR